MDYNTSSEILSWHYESDLNFIGLLNLINDNKIEIKVRNLMNSGGMATFYDIYLDMSKLRFLDYDIRFFIICHEIAHYKKIKRDGKEYHLNKLSINDVAKLYEHILDEEIFADKYAYILFKSLNKGKVFSYEKTQRLNEYENRIKFIKTANYLLGKIDNNEENYKNLIQQFIFND